MANHLDVLADIDGAIVAVPPRYHYEISMSCIEAGVHVLCEKPLAQTADEARSLVSAAHSRSVWLCVNNLRRLYPSARKVRALIEQGTLGAIRHVEMLWGEQFDWPAASGAYFGLASGGRGVLLDRGSHILDLMCWWLGTKPELVSYEDDSMGGSEAVAVVRMRHGECVGEARLSWLSRYANTFEVTGDRGSARGHVYGWDSLELTEGSSKRTLRLRSQAKGLSEFGQGVVDNFAEVLRGRARPIVEGADVLDSITLIDECYAARRRMQMPWYDSWRRLAD